MKKLSVKTRIKGNEPKYKENLNSIVSFLRNSEDRIEVKSGELVNIDMYENGTVIFSGDKQEFFNQLKK